MLADAADEGAVLEDKWRRWVDREKWKRLVAVLNTFICWNMGD